MTGIARPSSSGRTCVRSLWMDDWTIGPSFMTSAGLRSAGRLGYGSPHPTHYLHVAVARRGPGCAPAQRSAPVAGQQPARYTQHLGTVAGTPQLEVSMSDVKGILEGWQKQGIR